MDFATVFKVMCKEKGVTQQQALSSMKMGRNSAQRWINGWPSYETLSKVSAYFSVPFETLMICMETDDENEVASFFDLDAKKPADQKADGLRGMGYDRLTPENQKMIDDLIEKLLRSQSDA